MLVSFKGDEEKLIDSVISVLDAGREKFTFQEMNIISELQHKGIIINLERREVIRNGKKVGMTYTEFEILQLLAKNPGRVLSKEQIYDVVWKESYSGDYNIVMSHISHIREMAIVVPPPAAGLIFIVPFNKLTCSPIEASPWCVPV